MSTEQSSLDPQLIEQTKQQIRSLVAEIAQLTKEAVSPEEFYSQFLTRVVSALAAIGGAVWTTNEEGRLALQYQINLQQTRLRDNEEAQKQHGRLLYKALAAGEGMLVPPHSGAGEDAEDQAANPTEFLLVLGPLKTEQEVTGVLEVFQRSDSGPNTQRGYLRFLIQMCELATDFLKSHQLRHLSDRQSLWTQLEDFTHVIHGGLDPRETAYTIANEGRRLIECDRVSVAIRKGSKCYIEAISGQDVFDKRSNTVRLLGKLATAVVATGESVWYTGDTSNMAPQVEDAVQEYIDESHSKNVAVLPLKRPVHEEEDDPRKRNEPEPPIGALIVEQIEDSRVPQSMVQRVEVVCRHSSTALGNALEHQNLFLMPIWRAIGNSRWIVQARTLPKTISISAALVVALLALVLWPADFELHSTGKLEPVLHSDVFAGIEGRVTEIPPGIKHGSQVVKGQLLAQLYSVELNVAITDVQGRYKTAMEQYDSVHRQLNANPTATEKARLYGEAAAFEQQLASLKTQLLLYQSKMKDLDVTSPTNGIVTTWDLYNRLIYRPVQRGQVLMQVADPSGPWQLELDMAEDRMGHINRAQQAIYTKLRARLRETLQEKAADAPAEKIDAEVDQVPDAALSAKLRELLGDQLLETLRAGLTEIADEASAAEAAQQAEAEAAAQAKAAAAEQTDAAATPGAAAATAAKTPAVAQTPNAAQARPAGSGLSSKLQEVLAETSYGKARDALQQILDEMPPDDTRTRLSGLLDDGLDDRLPVSFILSTDPSTKFQGHVAEIHLNAEPKGEQGNTVLIKVDIDKEELPHLRPGATVNAQVYCGRRAIGYVWFHDLIAFIQSRVLFRYF